MTNNIGRKKQKPTEKKQYNPLDKQGTKLTRRDFIETEYVNGVKDPETGKQVIRPLDATERAWLSQFILETEHGNFKKDEELKTAENDLKAIRRDFKAAKKAGNGEEMARLLQAEKEQYDLVLRLRESHNTFYITDEDRSVIFNKDNERRRDIYNNAKVNGNLVMFDLDEYEKFSTEACDLDPEALLLERSTKRGSR